MHYSNDLNCLYLVSTYVAVIRFDVLIINGPKKYYCYDIFRILRLLSKFKSSMYHSKQFHISGPDSQLTLTIFRSIINKSQSIQIKCFENCQLEPK